MNDWLPPGNWRRLSPGVSNNDGRDRNHVVAAEPKRCLSFSRPKPRLSKSDPASAKPRSVGGKHQVLRCQRAVLDRPGASLRRRDNYRARRMIHRSAFREFGRRSRCLRCPTGRSSIYRYLGQQLGSEMIVKSHGCRLSALGAWMADSINYCKRP